MTGFHRVLVLNRGEIAVRVIRALRDLGLQSVAIYSDADANSLHRRMADFAVPLTGNTAAETYLNFEKVFKAIEVSQADAVHPGYGFLSENAAFVAALEARNVKFIGPSSQAMHALGDKIEARKLMSAADVPTVPGSIEPLKDWHEVESLAKEIGYPMILKAAAGGGGRGMRVVRSGHELKDAFDACQREAQDYFGNPAIFCERYIETARHIEFQVLFDEHGNGVHLFERDCSIQRRHQKLLEEAPSTFLDGATRQKLGEIAVRAGKAVNYSGVGTVEFICESPDQCYFMEMNTRIQVEHPVTEMITGVDLIVEQIEAARGHPLPFRQEDIRLQGWAFETRINAEDAEKDFMPVPGVVTKLHLPGGPNVRVDTHLYAGYEIPPYYDSMIAKVITWAPDREEAMQRMRRALSELEVEGVPTTASFHEAVLADHDFTLGKFATRFIADKHESLMKHIAGKSQELTQTTKKLAAVLAAVLQQEDKYKAAAKPASFGSSVWHQSARLQAIGRDV